jgi:hypothetical protein
MFLSDEQAQARLEHNENFCNAKVVRRNEWAGNRTGKRIPDYMKTLIGVCARVDGQGVAAKEFGISTNTAHALAHGQNMRGQEPGRRELIDQKVEQVQDKALDLLCGSLGLVNLDEVKELDVKSKVGIVERLAGVVDKVKDKSQGPINNGNVFIVQAPAIMSSSEFETIDVKPVR